ncbi:MAG TPA: hypothetical protein VE261_00590 [Gaiellaceae bacterium]|nr:hypothetical protein [Gaiellaceae bacterium]
MKPKKRRRITLGEARGALKEIRFMAGDFEAARGLEDELRERVLATIALMASDHGDGPLGRLEQIGKLARAALTTFRRECA